MIRTLNADTPIIIINILKYPIFEIKIPCKIPINIPANPIIPNSKLNTFPPDVGPHIYAHTVPKIG